MIYMNEINDIGVLYEGNLVLPTVQPPVQFILCPVGLIGAGKSTVTKILAEKLFLVRISTDEIRKILNDKGLPYTDTLKIAGSLALKYIKLGYSIAIDADCAGLESQALISQAEKDFRVKPVWIRITAPEEIIIQRLNNSEKMWLFKTAEGAIKNYMDRKPLHENLTMPFVYTFDTSQNTTDKKIEEAISAIENKLGESTVRLA